MVDPERFSKVLVEVMLDLSKAQVELNNKTIDANRFLTRKELAQIKLQRALELG